MHTPLVFVDDVSFSYDAEPVLTHVSLQILPGDFLALIGPNGGGKSTLVKLITGLITPRHGTIRRTTDMIGYVPQNTDVNPAFPITALDVVLMGMRTRASVFGHSREARSKAEATLKLVGMEGFATRKIGALSGGQRQRVMIARALAGDPALLILDEPTSSIDPEGQREIYELLKRLNQTITILVVSHDIAVVVEYAGKVAHINRSLTYHDVSFMRTAYGTHQHYCEVELLRGSHE